MAQAPSTVSPRISAFFERKRRLAHIFAWLSMVLLLVELLALGSVLEFYTHPRAAAAGEDVCLLHRCLSREETDGSRLLVLDSAMKPKGESLRLLDSASAVLPEGSDLTVFYGSTASVLIDRQKSRSIDLGQKWDVLSAVRNPGGDPAWIFGWNEGKIVARRRDQGAWGPELPVAPSGLLDRLTASMDGPAGPLVAWRERASMRVKTALFKGMSFAPGTEFEIGDAQHWDAVLSEGRTLLAHYSRDDRTFEFVTLRIECCPGCASPLTQRKVAFSDPVLLLGRRVTGLATIVTGDRLRFFLTRPSTVMTASLPLATLQTDSAGGRLAAIPVDPVWRKIVGSINPVLLIFCSAAMVALGVTLLRERNRAATAPATPTKALLEPPAALFPRGMAYLLDLILLVPVFVALTSILDVSDVGDPGFYRVVLILMGTEFTYRFLMEWRLGWTIGKGVIGLRVTGIDGARLSFRGALIRNLLRIIDGQVPFGVILGVALILRTQRGQRLGDLAARTMVTQDLGPEI
jgi:uncharacterized RDD family membrane protein YckC